MRLNAAVRGVLERAVEALESMRVEDLPKGPATQLFPPRPDGRAPDDLLVINDETLEVGRVVEHLARHRAQAELRLVPAFGQGIPKPEAGEGAFVKRYMDRGRRELCIELANELGINEDVLKRTWELRSGRRRKT